MKKCSQCLEIKSPDKFAETRTVCKSCRNKQRAERPKKIHQVTVEIKECVCCNTEKSKDKFNIDSSRIGGLTAYCNDCRSNKNKKRYAKNPHIKIEYAKKYWRENKEKVLINQNFYMKNRRKTDPKFLLKRRLRARLYSALKSKQWSKTNSFVDYIGCSQEELKQHIEKQFTFGMSWDNAGEWHIDHITPLSSAETEEQMYKLCHYTNLQPMWALDNIKKGDKID